MAEFPFGATFSVLVHVMYPPVGKLAIMWRLFVTHIFPAVCDNVTADFNSVPAAFFASNVTTDCNVDEAWYMLPVKLIMYIPADGT